MEAFAYSRDLTPLLLAFILLSAIELPVVGLLLPWATARLIVLILSVWSLLWTIGFLASMRVHPHLLDDDGVRIRHGASTDIRIPSQAIASVAAKKERFAERIHIDERDEGRILNVTVFKQTNVTIALQRPTAIQLGDEVHEITQAQLYADDASGLVTTVRSRLESQRPAGGSSLSRSRVYTERRDASTEGSRSRGVR